MPDQLQGITAPRQIILQTIQNQRAAMLFPAGLDFFSRQPDRPDNTVIQCSPDHLFTKFAGKGETQVADIALRARPEVDADQ